VIAGVIDTSDKFIASDNVMGEQLLAVSLTVVINLSLKTMIPAIHNCSLVFTSPEVYFVCKAASH
jgi:hypothetical protein